MMLTGHYLLQTSLGALLTPCLVREDIGDILITTDY